MSILSWLSQKASKQNQTPIPPDDYPRETREAVRKWLQRIFPGENMQDTFWREVTSYKSKNGNDPVVNDIIWGILNERRGRFFKDGNLGLYRNETLSMCILLELERKEQPRLFHLIELITLDACSVQNFVWTPPSDKPIQPDKDNISTFCLIGLAECANELDMSIESLKLDFLFHSEALLRNLGTHRPDIGSRNIWNTINLETTKYYTDYKPPKRRTHKKQPVLYVVKS